MSMVEKARVFAIAAHSAIGQVRKYTGEPYIQHPASVVRILENAGYCGNENILAAAYLHDVIEDTKVDPVLILIEFGATIHDLVMDVTDISKPQDGNRAVRKAIDREHLAQARMDSQTIKLADLIDNGKDIESFDKDFAKIYFEEKRLLLKVLLSGDPNLYCRANLMVENFFK